MSERGVCRGFGRGRARGGNNSQHLLNNSSINQPDKPPPDNEKHLPGNQKPPPNNQNSVNQKPLPNNQNSVNQPTTTLPGTGTLSNSRNRQIRQSRFNAASLQAVNRSLCRDVVQSRAKVNGAQKCFNFTYKEPVVQPAAPSPAPTTKQTLGPGQHLLDPNHPGQLTYREGVYPAAKSDKLLHMLMGSLNFQGVRKGRGQDAVRMSVWFGPTDTPYSPSYSSLQTYDFSNNRVMNQIKQDMEEMGGCQFNCCLVTLYRDGKDHLPWHGDVEPCLGPQVAVVSLGDKRRFQFSQHNEAEYEIHLTHGSALLMKGGLSERWRYCVPIEYHDRKPRIELAFRYIKDTE